MLANLSGHDSHGVGMLPRYVDAVLEGGLKPNAAVQIVLDAGSLLTLDGQRGYGQVVGEQAMAARHRARQGARQLHHDAGATRTTWAASATSPRWRWRRAWCRIHFVNVLSRPVVAPWGGGDGRYGTNPCCIGIPLAGREPFVLDFATSRVAQGKMRVAHNKGVAGRTRLPDRRARPARPPTPAWWWCRRATACSAR